VEGDREGELQARVRAAQCDRPSHGRGTTSRRLSILLLKSLLHDLHLLRWMLSCQGHGFLRRSPQPSSELLLLREQHRHALVIDGLHLLQPGKAPRRVTNVRDDKILTSSFWQSSFEQRLAAGERSARLSIIGMLSAPSPSNAPTSGELPTRRRHVAPLRDASLLVEQLSPIPFLRLQPGALIFTHSGR
jgi:hypothetical protein